MKFRWLWTTTSSRSGGSTVHSAQRNQKRNEHRATWGTHGHAHYVVASWDKRDARYLTPVYVCTVAALQAPVNIYITNQKLIEFSASKFSVCSHSTTTTPSSSSRRNEMCRQGGKKVHSSTYYLSILTKHCVNGT